MMAKPEVKTLLLEKPLAESPREARKLLDDLKEWGGKYRIGYLFGDAQWSFGIPPRSIVWGFTAGHFPSNTYNWKREAAVSSFYGIHIIALLAEHGYDAAIYSIENRLLWCAAFSGRGLRDCMVVVNTLHPHSTFTVDGIEFGSPFGTETRVEVLARSIRRFLEGQQPEYGKEIELWSVISFLNRA